MKKKRVFSRIFAAALAVAIAAVTLITNSGMGLLVFADGEGTEATTEGNGSSGTYSVKIISPDVPADGKTYTYNFYQIIGGEVEADDGKNIIANPKWGEALGGENFDKVPDGKTPEGGMAYTDDNAGIGYYPTSEVLLTALSGTMSCEYYEIDSSGPKKGPLLESAYIEYCKILNSYGVSFDINNYMRYNSSNYFFKNFYYNFTKKDDGTYTWNSRPTTAKTRDVKGLVELLNAGLTDGTLKTVDLKAFADLLLNGVKVKIKKDETTEIEDTYKFITTEPQATQSVSSDDDKTEYTVNGLAPGYYLVTCVGEDNKLTNNGYESAMPIKPVSTMLVLVGPANDGVAEIVGKNAYSVPTVTLDMYQKPVKLDYDIKTTNGLWNNSGNGGYEHNVEDIETIIKDENWKNTGSFDWYKNDDRKEAILYRIGITLPLNFDQYKDSGYYLAVLDQYSHFGVASFNEREIDRVTNVRPYVYVKSGDNYTPVGRCRGNKNDTQNAAIITTVGEAIIETTDSNIDKKLTGTTNNTTYNKNNALGFNAHDLFCFGNLYDYTVQRDTAEGGDSEAQCIFKPGDTIYIYYPAILIQKNVFENENYLLNANRIWAVYSNNPHDTKKLDYNYGGDGCEHIANGEVGITPIAEANVNTYGVTLKVNGEDEYADGAKFALYRVIMGDDGKPTKEYAFAPANNLNSWVKWWIPESELQAEVDTNSTYKTIEDVLLNYSNNSSSSSWYAYLASSSIGIVKSGMKIRGLAAGDYYLQELTISSKGVTSPNKDTDNPDHDNLKKHHYKLAKEPIKFSIGNKYNDGVIGYLGDNNNEKTFISELTVCFLQDNPERAIDTYIYMPNQSSEDGNDVPVINGSIKTTFNASSPTTYATEDGNIEIRVYHKTINLIWLPETGGIGTTIFFIVGGMIVMTAVVMIITRFRIKRERL